MWKIQKLMLNLLLLSCLVACSSRSNVASLLNDAEVCMNEKPNSSLVLLDSIKHIGELSEEQNALWCLLHTIAMDKLSIAHASDSLIQISVNYYADRDRADRKMQSYYYCGRVYQDLNDAVQAQSYYLKAEDIGKDSKDYPLLGRLYGNLGALYTFQELNQLALECELKALYCFNQTSESVAQSKVLTNIARAYICETQLDSAVYYYSKALSYTAEDHNPYIMNELAEAYCQMGDYTKALQYAKDAYNQMETTNDSCLVSFTLGNVYRGLGQVDSAYSYYMFCLRSSNIYTLEGSYYALGQLKKDQNDFSNYVLFQEKYEMLNDSIERQNHKEILAKIQSLYDYHQIEKKKEYFRHEADRKTLRLYQICLIGGGVFILLGIFIAYIFTIHRNKEERINQTLRIREQEYRKSQQYLKDKEEAMIRLKEQFELEKQKEEDLVNSLGRQLDLERKKKEDIVVRLHKQLELEQQKKVEIEDQLRSQLEIELQKKAEVVESLGKQLEQEQQKKVEMEKRMELMLAISYNNESTKVLLEKADITKEEILFRNSKEYIGLCNDWTKMDKEKWSVLIDLIDHLLYIDFTHRLRFLYPSISEFELQICYLVKLKIPVKRIACLLSSTSQTISINRNRLYTKITGDKGSSKDFDSFILNL